MVSTALAPTVISPLHVMLLPAMVKWPADALKVMPAYEVPAVVPLFKIVPLVPAEPKKRASPDTSSLADQLAPVFQLALVFPTHVLSTACAVGERNVNTASASAWPGPARMRGGVFRDFMILCFERGASVEPPGEDLDGMAGGSC